ncbi:hydrogenase maturation nickel metallochaperone HypA [Streptomyces sp. TRM49041]|uniref:hydrogenase maturation nickel metallochaperone HypA/HybF n=1 Tax=Streptomyces sp. TRM49041 TaxID=2603216 RepID=UPI0011EDF8CA|nr:hydrogenase maturation nickel metallochaperone HypA [Streptomyces sp. TRM49041]
MHELSIATSVVEAVEDVVREHGAEGVESVRLRVGALAGVVPDALRFCFDLAAEGTPVAGAVLVVEDVAARARCAGCDGAFAVGSPPDLTCPECGASAAELLAGRELEIAGVGLVQPGTCRAEPTSGGPAAGVHRGGDA